jgi:hypothetical protein
LSFNIKSSKGSEGSSKRVPSYEELFVSTGIGTKISCNLNNQVRNLLIGVKEACVDSSATCPRVILEVLVNIGAPVGIVDSICASERNYNLVLTGTIAGKGKRILVWVFDSPDLLQIAVILASRATIPVCNIIIGTIGGC